MVVNHGVPGADASCEPRLSVEQLVTEAPREAGDQHHVWVLLGAPGPSTRNKKLLGAPGIATRSKQATKFY